MLNIYKPISVTPFQLIKNIRVKYPELYEEKIAYAGRLDPMAHGVMIYLVGDETKQRDRFQKMTKVYKTKIIFGIETDTYDPMGIITKTTKNISIDDIKNVAFKYSNEIQGLRLQKYPPFSYPKINGEPMYKLAREGRLKKEDIPEKEIFIYSSQFTNFRKENINTLVDDITAKVAKVDGDFRQQEIKSDWKNLSDFEVVIADAKFEVSSGTYIRSLAHEVGLMAKTGALAYDILRTRVGDYELKDSVRL